jgi:hypothetical protein
LGLTGKKILRWLMGVQQRFNSRAQRAVVGAGPIEERSAAIFRQFERLIEKSFFVHASFPKSAGSAQALAQNEMKKHQQKSDSSCRIGL